MPKKKQSKKRLYLFIDTDVFVQCCKFERSKDGDSSLNALLGLLDKREVVLILPEVVQKEFDKHLKEATIFENDEKTRSSIKSAVSPQEKPLDDRILKLLNGSLDDFFKKKRKVFAQNVKIVKKIFKHKNTQSFPLTTDDFLDGYRMFLEGIRPAKGASRPIQNDAVIVAGLKSFLEKEKDFELVICSHNHTDFADEKKTGEEEIQIHPDLDVIFNQKVDYYIYLSDFLNKRFNIKLTNEQLKEEKKEQSTAGVPDAVAKQTDLIGKSI